MKDPTMTDDRLAAALGSEKVLRGLERDLAGILTDADRRYNQAAQDAVKERDRRVAERFGALTMTRDQMIQRDRTRICNCGETVANCRCEADDAQRYGPEA